MPSKNDKQAADRRPSKPADSVKPSSVVTSTTASSATTISQSSSTSTTTEENHNDKKKRFINDDQLDGLLDSESDEVDSSQLPYFKTEHNNDKTEHNNDKIDHTLHAKVQEVPVKIHDNADSKIDLITFFRDLNLFFSRTSRYR